MRVRWAGHAARMRKVRSSYNCLGNIGVDGVNFRIDLKEGIYG
jgi:hypothetical protein